MNYVAGLDIGTTKIACFIGIKTENGKIKILGYGKTPSTGVEFGVVRSVTSTAQSIRRAVDMACEQAGVTVEEVYVGIAGQHIKSIQNMGIITIPPEHSLIEQEDIDRLINDQTRIPLNAGEEIIHVFPQDYYVDGEPLTVDIDPVGVAAQQLKANFHIVYGNTRNLVSIHKSIQMAGLRTKKVVLEPIASALAVLDNIDRTAGVALVDIGGGTTDIAIFHDGIIRYTSVLPLAGNAITKDITEKCLILKPQAETLKTRFGSCLPESVNENDIISIPGIHNQPAREISMRTLAQIINQRTDMLLEQVNYEIREKAKMGKELLAGIVITGGGAMMREMKSFTEFKTLIDTRIGLPNMHLDQESPEDVINPMYATGIGLVIFGLDHEEKLRSRQTNNNTTIEETPEEQEVAIDTEEQFSQYNGEEEHNDHAVNNNQSRQNNSGNNGGNNSNNRGTTPNDHAEEDDLTGTRNRKSYSPKTLLEKLENYFDIVFNDSKIRNEGDDERDIC